MNARIVIGGLILALSAAACGQQPDRPPAQSRSDPAPVQSRSDPAPAQSRTDRTPAPAVEPAIGRPFLMAIEDVFSIAGRATIVTGRIETGMVSTGDEIEIVGIRDTRRSRVTGVEMFRRNLDSARAGDNVGILLGGVTRDQVERGQVLARPGSIRACSAFDASIAMLRDRDGRSRPLTGSRSAQFYFRTTDIAGTMSGSSASARITLAAPIAMNPGHEFSIRESGSTIGSGTVLRCR